MTDKIPSFKEEIDNIHVPIEKLDAIITNTVQSKVVTKKKSFRNRLLYSVGAAVLAIGLLIGSASVSPAMASIVSHFPFIGSIFSVSGDKGLERVSNMGLTHVVKQSETIDGKTVTIDEVFYDGTRFTISYSFKTDKPLGIDYLGAPLLTVNGESIGNGIGYSDGAITEVTPTYSTWIASVFVDTPEIRGKFDLDFTFEGKKGERWEFSVPVVKQKNVVLVPIDHTQEVDYFSLTATDLRIGPGGILLSYQVVSKEYPELTSNIRFQVEDSFGNELIVREGGSEGGQYLKGEDLFDPIDNHTKEVTITPYLWIPNQGEWGITDWKGNIVDVDVSQYDHLDIEFDSFTVELP